MSVLLSRDGHKMASFCRCTCSDGIHVNVEKAEKCGFIPPA